MTHLPQSQEKPIQEQEQLPLAWPEDGDFELPPQPQPENQTLPPPCEACQ